MPVAQDYLQSVNNIPIRSWNHWEDVFGTIAQGTKSSAEAQRLSAENLFRSRVEGIRGGYEELEDELGDEFSSQGVHPFFARQMLGQARSQIPGAIAGARGESQAAYNQGLAQLFQSDAESRVSVGLAKKQLGFQNYLGKKAREAARRNRKFQTISAVANLGLSGLGIAGLAGVGPFSGLASGSSGAGATAGGGGYGYYPGMQDLY